VITHSRAWELAILGHSKPKTMRNFTFPLLTLVILSLPAAVRSQINQNWATGLTASSAANAFIANDLSGNVYVAGNTSAPAYTLIKYNSAGNLQWSVTGASGSSNPNSGGFRVSGVGTDNAGNCYLVSNGSSGIVVVAYNPSGTLLWSTILNTGGRSATARVMTVDGTGNVFIGGQVILSTANPIWAYLCARVSNGIQHYLSTFEGSANQFSYVTAITCDKSGNAYVTGTSTGAHTYITRTIFGPVIIRHDTSWDMGTVKFDSSGNTSWANVYNAGINCGDFGFAVAVDPTSGNVYALGQSSGSSFLGDLIAYSSTGSQLWINQSTTAPNNNAIAVDPSGNIITGGTYGFNVSKYSSAGVLTWSYSNSSIAIYGVGPSDYLAMALDKSGNSYVTGPNTGFTEYFTAEITTSGTLGWTTTYSSTGSAGSTGIAVYTPTSRTGMIVYPQIDVTGTAANNTNFTTVQYNYHPVNHLGYNPETATGLNNALSTTSTLGLLNYPNPFHGATTISYTLSNDSHVTLQVYDQTGKHISSLFDGDQKAGTYTLPFTAARLAPGVYHYQVVATTPQGNFIQTKQMLVL
jgi:Beta-propeller repeat